jgi:hypothetical protein
MQRRSTAAEGHPMTTEKIDALRAFLGTDADITPTRWDANTFDTDEGEFLVLTDEEADARVIADIEETLWGFRAGFLADFLDIDRDCAITVIEALSEKCEDANETLRKLVGDRFDELCEEAIRADGRGHFLSSYDGVENEQDGLFIYRTN